ncbi:MAG: hypothetical protein OXC07_03140 [Kistimonas sp.]|nr:hypothetical protein [Kistimonas sp.]
MQPPRFDFLFINTDQDLYRLFEERAAQGPQADILLMTRADGLTRDNLVNWLSILDDGQHLLREGRLCENGNTDWHLILDVRQLTGEEIAAFNDLLDPVLPVLYHKPTQSKRALGRQTSVTTLARRYQVPVKGNTNVAGGDFWRRINRPGNTWRMPLDSAAMDVDCSRCCRYRPGPGKGRPTPVLVKQADIRRALCRCGVEGDVSGKTAAPVSTNRRSAYIPPRAGTRQVAGAEATVMEQGAAPRKPLTTIVKEAGIEPVFAVALQTPWLPVEFAQLSRT